MKDCMYNEASEKPEHNKPTAEEIWDYCSKISHEWWQITMDKWNSLSEEEKGKYNQFIGFNDFSDYLMNITAGALFQLRDTGKLKYEEGSLLLERPSNKPVAVESADEQDYTNICKKHCNQNKADAQERFPKDGDRNLPPKGHGSGYVRYNKV